MGGSDQWESRATACNNPSGGEGECGAIELSWGDLRPVGERALDFHFYG